MWQDYLTEFSGILNRVVARLDAGNPLLAQLAQRRLRRAQRHTTRAATRTSGTCGTAAFRSRPTKRTTRASSPNMASSPSLRCAPSKPSPQPEDRTNIFTPVMLAHQKNNEGNSIIHDYLLKDYPEPKDFASFLYVSQVLQAEGIKIGAEHFRRSRPETMGSIFWQLNDCWPVASWSSIDYYGRWKALQYYARRFYAPILVSPHVEDGSVKVYIVSDKTEAQPATLRVRLMDFDGKVLLEETVTKSASIRSPARSISIGRLPNSHEAGGANTSASLRRCRTHRQGDAQLSRNLAYLAPTKEVHLKPAHLTVDTTGSNGKFKIRITSPVLARSVYLSFGIARCADLRQLLRPAARRNP